MRINIPKKFIAAWAIFILLYLPAVSQTAQVTFEGGGPSSYCPQVEVSVEFGFSSADSVKLYWGDGAMATYGFIPDPRQHVYDTSGVYKIVFCVFLGGVSDCDTLTVTILPASFAKFGVSSDTICAGATVSFSDSTAGTVVSYLWNFDDFSSPANTSNNPNPTHTYELPGVYYPTLTVNDGTCITRKNKQIVVLEDTALLNITWNTNPCPCNSVQFFSSGTATQWQWDFGDNTSANNTSTLQNPTHVYTTPGKYIVTVRGTDASSICTETNKFVIRVCPDEIDSSISLSDNNWYFGDSAALNFSTNPPLPRSDNVLYNFQGGSTISDPYTGNLLFYTNGMDVINGTHTLVQNGSGLTTNGSASQGSLIVPYPGNPNLYYIFISPANSWYTGYRYSIVDISKDSIIVKNQLLHGGGIGFEQLSGVTKTYESTCSPGEYWVVMPSSNNNIRCYPVTTSGIGVPVNNNFNWSFSNDVGVVEIAFSHDRTKMAVYGKGGLWVFDFNYVTGVLSNPIVIPNTSGGGIAFSKSGRFLYTTNWSGTTYQVDLFATNIYQNISRLPDNLGSRGTMWYGLDDKIYISTGGFRLDSIAVIENPDDKYPACNHRPYGRYVGPGKSHAGLQNIVPYHVSKFLADTIKADFTLNANGCLGDSTAFQNTSLAPAPKSACAFYQNDSISYQWDFGDGNFSFQKNPRAHLYASTGTYSVTLIVSRPFVCVSDTLTKIINISTPTTFTMNPVICQGDIFTSPGGQSLTSANTYLDTIPNVLGCDSIITINLDVKAKGLSSQTITACDSTQYNGTWYYLSQTQSDTLVAQSHTGCDSIITTNLIINNTSLGSISSSICPGQTFISPSGKSYTAIGTYLDTLLNSQGCDSLISISLSAGAAVINNVTGASYCDSALVNSVWYYASQTISDTLVGGASSGCDSIINTAITITPSPSIGIQTSADTILSGQSILVNVTGAATYLWNNGSIDSAISVSPTTNSIYCVTGYNNTCFDTACVEIYVIVCSDGNLFIPNAFSPNGDGENDMLCIYGLQCVNGALMNIYNRWGELVYSSNNISDCWDGKHKGILCNSEVYIFKLDITSQSGESISVKGNITLIR